VTLLADVQAYTGQLRDEVVELRKQRDTLRDALVEARDLYRWMTGCGCFCPPDGQASVGWLKSQPTRDKVDAALGDKDGSTE